MRLPDRVARVDCIMGLWDRVFKAQGRYKDFEAERSIFMEEKEGQWMPVFACRRDRSPLESSSHVLVQCHRLVCGMVTGIGEPLFLPLGQNVKISDQSLGSLETWRLLRCHFPPITQI